MVSPVLSRGKNHVSTWKKEATRRLSARAAHFGRADYSILKLIADYSILKLTVTTEAATWFPACR